VSSDPSEYFARLDEFLARARVSLAPQRAELAAWYGDFFRRRRGQASATHMVLKTVGAATDPHPRWEFGWYPGSTSRYNLFTPVTPMPEFATAADAVALGLPADPFPLRFTAFQDMAVDAWVDAGGFGFRKRLMIRHWPFERADAPRPWVDLFREDIRRWATGVWPARLRWGLGPPEPLGLPAVEVSLIDVVRNGEENAVNVWADAVERAGATEAAELLRWLPRFHAMIAAAVRAVSPQFGFAITVNGNGFSWWWIGDCGSGSDNANARNLNRLMAAWNEAYPAVEWLLRRLNFPHANVEAIRHATDEPVETRAFNLSAGDHLEPVADDVRVVRLDVPWWEPIEGDVG
jgi:hypothetical protein